MKEDIDEIRTKIAIEVILDMIKGEEMKFITVISKLQELCCEFEDIYEALELESSLDIDEVWRSPAEVFDNEMDSNSRDNRRDIILENLSYLLDMLEVRFKE